MPQPTNRISQFWQELKRRKVVRVITVYAAAAFVILELVDMIADPFGLPDWTFRLVVVLLTIGFLISVIVSWIYDIHPEGGIVKTEPAHKVKVEDVPQSSNSWKLASYISFVVIVGLVGLNIIPRSSNKKILEKSIAVLPFDNMGSDEEYMYLGDAFTDEIIMELQKIEAFDRVLSRTSTMQYAEQRPTIPEIAEKLNVSYIIEGAIQRHKDTVSIRVQVIRAQDEDHVWAEEYDRLWEHIFTIQDEIAFKVANELKMVLSPEERQLIEKIPTNNLYAYELYLLGKNQINRRPRDEDLWRALEYFQQAVELDSTYALAYSGLAEAYYQLVNSAIHSPAEAYPKAKAYSNKALELDERLANSHCMLALVKQSFEYDFEGAEKEYIRALEIDPGSYNTHLYYSLYLSMMGRHDEAISHVTKAAELDPLSHRAATRLIITNYFAGYKSEAVKSMEELRDSYPDDPFGYWFCAVMYTDLGMYNEALSMLRTQISLMGDDNTSDEIGLQGYLYGRLGQKEKAEEQLERLEILSSEGYYIAPRTRAWIYLGLNDVDKAIEILERSFENHSLDPGFLQIFPSSYTKNDSRFLELKRKVGIIQ